jgi:hypothetical protein
MNPCASRVGVSCGVKVSSNEAGRSAYTYLLLDFFSYVGLNIFDRGDMLALAVKMFL